MKSGAKSTKFIRIITISLILIIFMFSYAFLNEDNKAFADSYPKYIENTSEDILQHIWLSKEYEFISYWSPEYYVCTGASIIRHNGDQEETMVEWKPSEYEDLTFAGKCNGKYYFNSMTHPAADSIYTYTLGSKKLKKLKNSKNLNFAPFKKTEDTLFNTGLIDKRYALGVDFFPTDAAGQYKIYVYDLKKNIKRSLGYGFDVVRVDNRLYWVTTSNMKYTKKTKILVKRSKLNGTNKKTYKSYKAGFLKDSYGRAEIGKHYVKYRYFKTKGNDTSVHLFKRKYR